MFLRVLLCFCYFLSIEIAIANTFLSDHKDSLCTKDINYDLDDNCDLHCISNGLFDNEGKSPKKLTINSSFNSFINENLKKFFHQFKIVPKANSPPTYTS